MIDNCDGNLIPTQLKTKKIFSKNNSKIAHPKEIFVNLKQCEKCKCYYMGSDLYPSFKRYECAKHFNILHLDKDKQNSEIKNVASQKVEILPTHIKNKEIVETVKNAIMKDVFTDINIEKCAIDIFLQDKNAFNKRIGNINKVSLNFLNKCKQQLKEESENGNILFFRKYNYEKILNEYLSKTYHVDALKISLLSNSQEEKKIAESETLVREDYQQDLKNKVNVSSKNKQLRTVEKERPVPISRAEFQKLEKQNEQEERIFQEQEVISNIDKIIWDKTIGANYYIYEGLFRDGKFVEFRVNNTMKKKNPSAMYIFKYDQKPIRYVEYDGDTIVELIESTHPKIKKNKNVIVTINKERISNGKNPKKAIRTEIEQKRKEELVKKNTELEVQRKLKEERRHLQEERIKAEQEAKRLKELENKKRKLQIAKEEQESLEKLPQIGIKDFVVKRAVFKCMHSKHEVIDLAAAIKVVDDDGKAKLVKISAGYCKECKIYFIMESTYEKIRNMGVILCHICDEKSYMKNSFVNGMKLAKESILMQFGYTVSQTEGLSSTKRQKILAVIIDNHILSKSEIISYLDFFISQRKYQSRFELAVSKWEADREFVEEYKIGQYTQFGVNAIYRR
ncbi:MAG: hypothetical protein ACOX8K_07835 [Lachnospiraceae bacterium]